MPRPIRFLILSVALAAAAAPWAMAADADRDGPRLVVIEAFVREGSEASDAATKYLHELVKQRPGLHVVRRDVGYSDFAAKRLEEIARYFRIDKPATPTFYLGRQVITGFHDEKTTGREIEGLLTVEVFVREGCPRCARSKAYLATIAPQYPGLRFVYGDIIQNSEARARWERLCRQHDIQVPGIPTVHAFGKLFVGFDGPDTTGAKIETLLRSVTVPAQPADAPSKRTPRAQRQSRIVAVTVRHAGQRPRVAGDRRAESGTTKPGEPAPADAPPAPLAADEPPPPMPGDAPLPSVDESPSAAETPRAASERTENGSVTLPLIGTINVRDLGLPLFTLAVGLVDGFNPCAMWVLIFLLSILVNLQSRWKMLAVAGTFVVVSGLAYFMFMAAWMNVFFLVGYLRWIQVALGLMAVFIGIVNVKDFFAFKKGLTLSIPESAKPGIAERVRRIVAAPNLTAAVCGAVVLAVMVNVVEFLCTAGLPAVYTSILSQQGLPRWKCYAYLALYEVTYMLDDALMLGVVVITLSRRRLQEREGRWLKLVSGAIILMLGIVMLFKPEWLI